MVLFDPPFFTFPHPQTGGAFAQVKVAGSFALKTPTFANGITIPSGSYLMLIGALRVTGDPTREDSEEDYDSWLTTSSKPLK
jgi:hypothetical protein